MKHHLLPLLLSLPLTAALVAQEQGAAAVPNPKTPAHEVLATFVGTWRVETKMAAMPGVPGMEQASETTGTERAELICNGLWLKVTGEGVCNGKDSQGIWLLGYDPVAKTYQCVAVSNLDSAPCCMEASYDAATKTWDFHGDTPMGPFRSVFVQEGDRATETCYAKGQDGKEQEFMRSVRTRVKAPLPTATTVPASAKVGADATLPAPLAALHAGIGSWQADFRMEMPGAPPMTSKCREVVAAVCDGKWLWSDFTGEMMGAPFEGHGLTGYDDKIGKVVSIWIDSMNGALMRTDGSYDATTQTFALRGTCYDEQGKRVPVESTATSTKKDARSFRMVFGTGEGAHVMTIDYRRAGK